MGFLAAFFVGLSIRGVEGRRRRDQARKLCAARKPVCLPEPATHRQTFYRFAGSGIMF
jgi:hypothetical protein